uniref:Uncharacterized protein n=1 Tax=Rhizophora mucronata TaxID=61149 RepID=A0A2P2JPL5_RHIMU
MALVMAPTTLSSKVASSADEPPARVSTLLSLCFSFFFSVCLPFGVRSSCGLGSVDFWWTITAMLKISFSFGQFSVLDMCLGF